MSQPSSNAAPPTAFSELLETNLSTIISNPDTYWQLGIVFSCFVVALAISLTVQKRFLARTKIPEMAAPLTLIKQALYSTLARLIFPFLTVLLLKVVYQGSERFLGSLWLIDAAIIFAALYALNVLITQIFVESFAAKALRWVALPILFLHMVGLLGHVVQVLESISITLGNLSVSAYGVVRVGLFGITLFWLGRTSNSAGKNVIRRQQRLDIRTKEVAAKIFEISVFMAVALIFLQIMGINLTTLAVFGGALGVGLGFGLQSIASNFISGVIILLDRSLSIGDYVEFEEGKIGVVREMNLRSTTLETFDGKDIVVPNEKFITETFINWTHKDTKQRYRVDFSVAYDSDIHKLVPLIKEAVGQHEQVMSDPSLPIEELPDCEIDSFGDSGINMFVEFWIEGIDDGKNRVGGDLLLVILDTLRDNGFTIPFPQREVRVLDSPIRVSKV